MKQLPARSGQLSWLCALALCPQVASCGGREAEANLPPAGATDQASAEATPDLDILDNATSATTVHESGADAGWAADELVGVTCSGALPVMQLRNPTTNEPEMPDWSCHDASTRSDADAGADDSLQAGTARTLGFQLFPQQLSQTPERLEGIFAWTSGATVDLFFGPSTLGPPAVTLTIDQPSVTFEVPARVTQITTRVHALPRDNAQLSLIEWREYGVPLPQDEDHAAVQGGFIIQGSRDLGLNLALEGGMADPDKAVLFALATDCNGQHVSGAQLELIDDATGAPIATGTEPGDARAAYSHFALPDPSCTYSAAEMPAWMLANAPVNVTDDTKQHGYRLRISGRMTERDTAPVVFAEGEVELFRGVLTQVDSLPRIPR